MKKLLPYLALLISQIIWGSNFVVSKLTLSEIPVMTLAFLRFSLASVLIIPFLVSASKRKQKVSLEHIPTIFLIGMLMVTFNIAFVYEGITRIPAISASVIMLMIPILSVLGGWWFLKEHIYWVNLLGILMGSMGVFTLIGFPFFTHSMDAINVLGSVLILIASIFYVSGALLSKKMLEIYSPLILTANLFLVGSITFFIPAIIEYLQNPTWITHVSILGALGVLYVSVLSSVCAFFLLAWGLSKVELSKANLFQYITPLVATMLAVPFLHERVSYSLIVGFCLVILGVYWGTLGKQMHHHTHHSSHRI